VTPSLRALIPIATISVSLSLALGGACKTRTDQSAADDGCRLAPGAPCDGADLSHQDLRGVNLAGARLRGAILVGADLSRANLEGADLARADFAGARLGGANLRGALLEGANLPNVEADGASFARARLTGAVVGGSFTEADFSGATLTGALSANCLGNSPTSVRGAPRTPTATRCALRAIPGKRVRCPDGAVDGSPTSFVSCEADPTRRR
jgi:uncharacterized protein YjbI with pentapeptide repeats